MLHRSTPIAASRELAADRRATSCRPIADGRELRAELAAELLAGALSVPFRPAADQFLHGRGPFGRAAAGGRPSCWRPPARGR